MSLTSGTSINGVTGSLSILDADGAGTLRYLPTLSVNPQISRGDSTIQLVNNAGYVVNKVKGSASASVSFNTFIFQGLTNASFFNNAVSSGSGDTGSSGYSQLTLRSNNQGGEGAENYYKAKCAGMSGSVRFSNNGAAQALQLSMQYLCADPLSTTTALAAPPAGALATSGILGFAQASFSGASDVVAVSWNLTTGAQFIPGVVASSNPEFTSLPKGVQQTILDGTVTITQIKNPATRLGALGNDGTFVLNLGTTGNGIALTFNVMPMMTSKPTTTGIGYISSTYGLKSVDGITAPFYATNL